MERYFAFQIAKGVIFDDIEFIQQIVDIAYLANTLNF